MLESTKISFTNKVFIWIKQNYILYRYSGKHFLYCDNYYQEVDIETIVSNLINDEIRKCSTVKEVVGLIKSDPHFLLSNSDKRIEPERYINFTNGILDIYERKMIEHTPDIICFTQIPFPYNQNATSDEITEKLIKNFVKSNNANDELKKRQMLFEYLGVIISNVRGLKNFLFIEGKKDTGKSTYCGLIMRLLGRKAYSSIPISDLNENSFYLYKIAGKKANIITETDDAPLKDITTLKKLTGGSEEIISCKIKYEPNSQELTPRAMLIFAGNTIPSLWNSGDKTAFIQRMIPITFESIINDADKIDDILNKINMEYIIKVSIDRLYYFLDNNKIFTQPEQSYKMRQEILEESDIVYAFVKDCDTTNSEYKIHTKTLYEIFNIWLRQNGYSNSISSNMFTRKLKEQGFENSKFSIDKSGSLIGFKGVKPPSKDELGIWGNVINQQKK